jgi:phospholipid/cholesterol/gamma-HCH transport system substrate-binding protein
MPRKIEFKVGLFVTITTLLIVASLAFIAYKKGVFTHVYTYTLSATSGDGLTEGLPVEFSGFKIGQVYSLELSDDGSVSVKIRIPQRHAKWIRNDSAFTLDRPIIGSARIVVTTPNLNSPELPPEKVVPLVRLDSIDELIKTMQPIIQKIDRTATNIEKTTAAFAGKKSLVEMAIGKKESVDALYESINKTRDILTKVDKITAKTDEKLYGDAGLLAQVSAILKDLIGKLKKLDTTIDNVNKITSNAADSTEDLGKTKAELDAMIQSLGDLVKEIDRRIPFKKEPRMKLP